MRAIFGDIYVVMYWIIVLIVILLNYTLPSKKDYKKTRLDKIGTIINIILTMIYIPASCTICLFAGFLYDDPNPSEREIIIRNLFLMIFFSIPVVSGVSILESIIARKKGKSIYSFFIQFFPIIYVISLYALLQILAALDL